MRRSWFVPVARGPGRRVLVGGLVGVAVAALLATLVLRSLYDSERARALDALSSQVRAEAAVAEQLIADHLKVMTALAAADEVRSGDPDRVQALIERFDPIGRGFTGGMGWVDAAGRSQASAIAGARSGVSFAERDYFVAARAGSPTVGAVSPSAVADQVIVPFAVPSYDSAGVLNGVLVAALRLDAEGELARTLRLFDASDYFVDRAGLVVSGSPSRQIAPVAPGSWPANPPAPEQTRASGRTDALGRTDRVVAWAPVPSAGWTAVRSLPEGDVFGSARRVALLGTIAIAGACLTAAAVTAGISRRVQRAADAAAEAERAGRRAHALATALSEIASGVTRAEVARAVLDRALPAVGAVGGRLLEPVHGRMRVVLDATPGEGAGHDPDEEPSLAEAWSSRRVVLGSLADPTGAGAERTSVVALPLLSGDDRVGVLEVTWPTMIEPAEVAALEVLAGRVAIALDRARQHEAEHRAIVLFQQSVLPLAPDSLAGMVVEGCYSPADERFGAGGDWYDAVAIDEHRLMLVIGDVVGHGIESAGTMGRLSTTVHALARHGTHGPADILRALDEIAEEHPDARCASVLCVLLDLRARTFEYANAGHLPALAVERAGGVRLLDENGGSVIGADDHRHSTVRPLDDVERFVLYTDGLVDRTECIDDAIERLARTAREVHDSSAPEAFSERFRAAALRTMTEHDDVAIITAVLPPPATVVHTMTFAADTAAPGQARRFVRESLTGSERAHLIADAELLVSELVSNAVEHAHSGGEVVLRAAGGGLRVEVTDRRPGMVEARPAPPTAWSGRGLWIVEQTAERWGIDAVAGPPPGKRIWFEL